MKEDRTKWRYHVNHAAMATILPERNKNSQLVRPEFSAWKKWVSKDT